MLMITIVGNRCGKAAVNWPGVTLVTAFLTGICSICFAILYFALGAGFPQFPLMLVTTFLLLAAFVGSTIKRNLQLPPETLPHLR